MSLKLEDVKGIGKKVDNLKDAGIDTLEKLASSSIDDLLNIKGIGKASAEKFIKNAKDLLETESPGSKAGAEKVSKETIKEEEKSEEKGIRCSEENQQEG